jgi:hypothetical protein
LYPVACDKNLNKLAADTRRQYADNIIFLHDRYLI